MRPVTVMDGRPIAQWPRIEGGRDDDLTNQLQQKKSGSADLPQSVKHEGKQDLKWQMEGCYSPELARFLPE